MPTIPIDIHNASAMRWVAIMIILCFSFLLFYRRGLLPIRRVNWCTATKAGSKEIIPRVLLVCALCSPMVYIGLDFIVNALLKRGRVVVLPGSWSPPLKPYFYSSDAKLHRQVRVVSAYNCYEGSLAPDDSLDLIPGFATHHDHPMYSGNTRWRCDIFIQVKCANAPMVIWGILYEKNDGRVKPFNNVVEI